jgi:hypothetical protein
MLNSSAACASTLLPPPACCAACSGIPSNTSQCVLLELEQASVLTHVGCVHSLQPALLPTLLRRTAQWCCPATLPGTAPASKMVLCARQHAAAATARVPRRLGSPPAVWATGVHLSLLLLGTSSWCATLMVSLIDLVVARVLCHI